MRRVLLLLVAALLAAGCAADPPRSHVPRAGRSEAATEGADAAQAATPGVRTDVREGVGLPAARSAQPRLGGSRPERPAIAAHPERTPLAAATPDRPATPSMRPVPTVGAESRPKPTAGTSPTYTVTELCAMGRERGLSPEVLAACRSFSRR